LSIQDIKAALSLVSDKAKICLDKVSHDEIQINLIMAAGIWKTGSVNATTTTLNGSITDTDATIALTSATGLQYPGVIVVDRVDANDAETPLVREYISYTGISGNSLTGCDRSGLGGSTAQDHSSGAKVEEVWSVTHWNDFIDAALNVLTSAGALDTTKVVDLTTAQVLTNKDISSATNTLPSTVTTLTGTQTLTNKRITPKVVTTTDDATAVINTDITDMYCLTAVANATEFTLTGTPVDGQKLIIRLKDAGAGKALTWTGFTAIGVTLPTTTVASKTHYVGCIYNAAAGVTRWEAVAVVAEA